jgi:hypothetical protein
MRFPLLGPLEPSDGGPARLAPFRRVLPRPVGDTAVDRTRGGPPASARTILTGMTTPTPRCPTCGAPLTSGEHSLLSSSERHTPWMIHDLPRIAWVVEYRAAELTDDERQIVRDATARMLAALDRDTA